MPQKKRATRLELVHVQTKRLKATLVISTITVFLLLFGVLLYYFNHEYKRIDIKEKQLEMTKLPKDVKKSLTKTATTSASIKIPILIYHYVEIVTDKRDTIRQSLDIQPYIFEKQIETLQNAGYTFITPSQIGDYLDNVNTLPHKPVILSFDDGYRDFYTDVLPIIKRHNVKVVAYIVPGFLNHINYMYDWQVHDLVSSGLVEIGAHTMHHVYLKGAAKQQTMYEIKQSKESLEQMLYIPIVSFAYPYGAFNQQAIDIVKQAGFTTAVSTIGGNQVNEANRFFLYRIHPGSATGPGLISAMERNYPKPY